MMLRPVSGANEARATARRNTVSIRDIDRGLALSFALLLLLGLVVLYSASYYNAQDSGSGLSEVYSQLLGIGVGAAGIHDPRRDQRRDSLLQRS